MTTALLVRPQLASVSPTATEVAPPSILDGRFQICELLHSRGGISRYLALDQSTNPPTPVQLVGASLSDSNLPSDGSIWPSIAWEERLRERCRHDGMPQLLGRVVTEDATYLVLEKPQGVHLWDAWDDVSYSTDEKFGWLIQVVELLTDLHAAGAILEGLRPDHVSIMPNGRVVLDDPGSLLPLPLPKKAAVIRNPTAAPELFGGAWVDSRADLYCFGAMMYALVLGREISDIDFNADDEPQPFLEQFPDAHPLLGRIISKTFCADRSMRFPTPDPAISDPTGFSELRAALEHCRIVMGRVRLDVASWTSIGMTRSGNEDTFAVLHTAAGLADDLGDHAIVLVADGMGGSAAGEVAASIAVHELYQSLAMLPTFGRFPLVYGASVSPTEHIQSSIITALKQANRAVHEAGQQGNSRRGMGCTAEVVYIDGRHLMIGHVGDSRTYRFRLGRLALLTRDHTYVNRLVEHGEITAEEAESHPRRAELQQALGGWAEVEPDFIDLPISTGDWVLVCSDGLSNTLKRHMIQDVFERSRSADDAARRFVNLANALGANDNVTVCVVRAM